MSGGESSGGASGSVWGVVISAEPAVGAGPAEGLGVVTVTGSWFGTVWPRSSSISWIRAAAEDARRSNC